jgi:hypothetical protein
LKYDAVSFQDADKGLAAFAFACAQAGPSYCAIAENNSTPATILSWIDALIMKAYDAWKITKTTELLSDYSPTVVRRKHVLHSPPPPFRLLIMTM